MQPAAAVPVVTLTPEPITLTLGQVAIGETVTVRTPQRYDVMHGIGIVRTGLAVRFVEQYTAGMMDAFDAAAYNHVYNNIYGWGVLHDRPYTEARAAEEEAALEQHRQHQAAEDKARLLLLSVLTPTQCYQLRHLGEFDVIGSVSKDRYSIREGSHGNVLRFDQGSHRHLYGGYYYRHYCGQPKGIPKSDMMLAQALTIAYNEPAFLSAANMLGECR